ncbi:hypothetical protein HanIR_Chr17g0896551 [Helianthus annuus]|nr:hypothetical protein HanIR_Chr17g0896551 [Helianthus annuus]
MKTSVYCDSSLSFVRGLLALFYCLYKIKDSHQSYLHGLYGGMLATWSGVKGTVW